MATREKIIEASIELFNEQGFANVRLQHIADRTGISVGNLAYHFRNKEAIITEAYRTIGEELQSILSQFRSQPNFLDLENQLTDFYCFIVRFPFYFIDIVEIKRSHPHLHQERQQFIMRMIIQIRKRFEYNVNRGVLKPELFPGHYDQVAHTIWMVITFWVTQSIIREETNDIGSFKSVIWSQIYPFFTSKGIQEYKRLVVVRS